MAVASPHSVYRVERQVEKSCKMDVRRSMDTHNNTWKVALDLDMFRIRPLRGENICIQRLWRVRAGMLSHMGMLKHRHTHRHTDTHARTHAHTLTPTPNTRTRTHSSPFVQSIPVGSNPLSRSH